MDERILSLIMDKPIFIPRVLLANYRNLNITEEELVVIIMIISQGNKVVYDPISISNLINMDKIKVMELINNLIEKGVINSIIEKNNKKKEEYLSLEPLYMKIVNIVLDKEEENKEVKHSVFDAFEQELGKTISPMQYNKIIEWINSGISDEIIIEALREAVLNDVKNFNYIDSIISNWQSKGIKTKEDILKEKAKHRSSKEKKDVEVMDIDWLNEND